MHTIHQGDALEILKTMPDQSVDCILTGPPYYGEPLASDDPRAIGKEDTPDEYLARLCPVLDECARVLKHGTRCYVMIRGSAIADNLAAELSLDHGEELARWAPVYGPMSEYRMTFLANSFRGRYCDRLTSLFFRDSLVVAIDRTRVATMSPEIARYCIEYGSSPGDTILDPFAGTGMTISTAVSMGRNAIGIEIAPSQIELIEKRMELLDSQVLERR